jgi:Domain of unknown function (DUF4258)
MILLSRHAQRRAQQRGVTQEMIELVLENADIEKNVGDDCTLIRVSRRQAAVIQCSDKLSRLALIWSDPRAQIVTVLPVHKSASGRRYRSRHVS